MNIQIFNTSLLEKLIPNWDITPERLSLALDVSLNKSQVTDINVAFVPEEEIHRLNKEYRKKDEVTDVLSFELEDNIGEIYISPGYIAKDFTGSDAIQEVLRVIIHGILHLDGYEHAKKFNDDTKDSEKMYIIQEGILNNVSKELKL